MKLLVNTLPYFCLLLVLAACNRDNDRSRTTNWKYNDEKWGGYERNDDFAGQETPPNMVLVPGGTFVMGFTEEDVPYDWDNIPRRVTVSSFYMDQTEISNEDYMLYLDWTRTVYADYPEVWQSALPDTLVWRDELSYNEPYVTQYLRHPAYGQHPVRGRKLDPGPGVQPLAHRPRERGHPDRQGVPGGAPRPEWLRRIRDRRHTWPVSTRA